MVTESVTADWQFDIMKKIKSMFWNYNQHFKMR